MLSEKGCSVAKWNVTHKRNKQPILALRVVCFVANAFPKDFSSFDKCVSFGKWQPVIREQFIDHIYMDRPKLTWTTEPSTMATQDFRQHCLFNSLWPSYVVWWHRTESTLAQVMACCLMAPSHYLNQYWLIISKSQWQSPDSNFTRNTSAINH